MYEKGGLSVHRNTTIPTQSKCGLVLLTVEQTFFAYYLTFSKASTAALGLPKLFLEKSSKSHGRELDFCMEFLPMVS